jgi:hypothetical protein
MGIPVKFYNFSKDVVSTKRPTDEGITTTCLLKEPCSIISPTISITGIANVYNYNYAYIEDFKRYYFISNWTFQNGLWYGSLSVDVLASFKDEIGAATEYVVRAESKSDGNIVDTVYPTKANCTIKKTVLSYTDSSNPFVGGITEGGFYVVGVFNTDENTAGGISCYLMTKSQYKKFQSKLLDSSNWVTEDAITKMSFNPLQYIATVTWYPFLPVKLWDVSDWEVLTELPIGWWQITGVGCYRLPDDFIRELNFTLTVPKHPQASSRGAYLNTSPYSSYVLACWPFGIMELDSTYLYNSSTISCEIKIDFSTGGAYLTVNNSVGNMIKQVGGNIGIPVQIAQIATNVTGALTGAQSAVGGAIAGATNTWSSIKNSVKQFGQTIKENAGEILSDAFMVGNFGPIIGALTGSTESLYNIAKGSIGITGEVFSGIGDGVLAATATLEASGSNGCSACYELDIQLIGRFFTIVDEDIHHLGRPLAQKVQISTLSGFVQTQDCTINTSGTATENSTIKATLNSGFLYE